MYHNGERGLKSTEHTMWLGFHIYHFNYERNGTDSAQTKRLLCILPVFILKEILIAIQSR